MDRIIRDLMIVIADLQVMNRADLKNSLNGMSHSEIALLKSQLYKLNSVIDMSSHLFTGKKVANGFIAGTKSVDGRIVEVLVDGGEAHYWCKPEDVKTVA